MIEFRMPSLGADMDFGTVIEWRIAPGDRVRRGDIVAVVDTDKAEIEVEIWQSGVVDRIVVEPGQKVPVGELLATLRADAGTPAREAPAAVPAPPAAEPRPAAAPPPPAAIAPLPPVAERVRATPLARRLAQEAAVDLARLRGTGPQQAITAADVKAATRAAAPAPERAGEAAPRAISAERLAAIRRRMASAMERSKREIPHYYLETEIDMSSALAWLAGENARRPVTERLLPAALLLKAVASGVAAAPELNGHWVDGAFRAGQGLHVGIVVSLRGGGLLVPTLHDVDRKDVGTLMRELREATGRARRATLRSSDASEATITVTSLGETGVETVLGVIYPPQVALVGFGRITERPWAEAGLLGARPVLRVTLSADHRASDGHRGARFLAALAHALARPESL
jgi:pyruvate dehydrogenase E2 component (dihydrolipoamide acetyltransferase)